MTPRCGRRGAASWAERRFNCDPQARIRPALAEAYALPEASLWLFDCFVAVYAAGSGADALEHHRDATLLSFNVLLSDASAFDGGTTEFADVGDDSRSDAGDARCGNHGLRAASSRAS